MSDRQDFLFELGTEELPPTALRSLERSLANGIESGLAKALLEHGEVSSYSTPRRLAVLVRQVASRQADQEQRRRGPPVATSFDSGGQPTRAALAFAASCGTSVEALQQLDEGKGRFLFFIGVKPGAAASELLPAIAQGALDGLPIPRRMRWGAGSAEFVRPVHWLLMLHGRQVVPARLLDTTASNFTHGHRFHAPRPLRITTPATYVRALTERGYVRPDFVDRRELIRTSVSAVARQLGGTALIGDALLEEVTALVEWPVALAGRFEQRFLELPREVLISTLQDHQRYFAVEDAGGRLMPHFITVSNIESRDPEQVSRGNERVVRPRLADAAFFFEQDRRQPLIQRRPALDNMTFQAKLGSLGDKTRRIHALAGEIAAAGPGERADAERAAELCKCDLLTSMVGEFPELQGIMGTYYALADGEAAEAAVAIREHYMPRAAGDDLPETHAGVAVALADKLDTLAGIFAIDEKPTGAKDPFGLRRAAIGVLRILIEKRLDLDLRPLLATALAGVRADIARVRAIVRTPSPTPAATPEATATPAATPTPAPALDIARSATAIGAEAPSADQAPVVVPQGDPVAQEVYDFIMERLRAYYLERPRLPHTSGAPLTTEMFDAILATRPGAPLDFDARLRALSAFLELPEATSLAAANKRITNILRKSGERESHAGVDVEALSEPAEIRLYDAMRALRQSVTAALAQREYANALGRLAQLRQPVDAFFDQVRVMDDDPSLRSNRLTLLADLRGLFMGIADLSRLPG